MANYLIGDIQGCDSALEALLGAIDFSPSRDTIYLLGDLVNRGPASAPVLRRLMRYGASARSVLGNHDLHLLAVAYGVRQASRHDTLQGVLQALDRHAMLEWLRHQPLARLEYFDRHPLLMVHAGVLPDWTAQQTVAYAAEVQTVLQSSAIGAFLSQMYGNAPSAWDAQLQGLPRLRVIVNALTRLRFCTLQGEMEFSASGDADSAPPGYVPWFDVPTRQSASCPVAFGHWSTLGWLARTDVMALDSGCVWGGRLSALRIGLAPDAKRLDGELIQVNCQAACQPGV